MIGHVTLGSNDLARAAVFYDALLGEAGEKRLIDTAAMIAWGRSFDQPLFAIGLNGDGAPATPGQGTLVAFVQTSRRQVDKAHARALALGAADGGAPALRGAEGEQGFYAGYVHDLDGHRLCIFYLGPNA